LIARALAEDIGTGDVTANATVPEGLAAQAHIVLKQPGVIFGLDVVEEVFRQVGVDDIDRTVVEGHWHDTVPRDVMLINGPARAILAGERVALNFLGHLSGIATVTSGIVAAIEGTKASVACTRKTTPGLRALEKYAVRAGGGMNHRFALYDAVLIKDNHVAIAGSIKEAIRRAKAGVGHMVKIEVEVDTLEQLREAMEEGIDAVLLDNMTPDQLREAVGIVAGRAITEASGRVTPSTAAAIAASGVDLISVGWVTHSAPVLDIGLDFVEAAVATATDRKRIAQIL
jgi:nicotinate-nucleotide pyrophosphorylase (carboxylating)